MPNILILPTLDGCQMMRVSFPMLLLLVMAALASWQAADGQTEEFQVRIYGFEEGLSHRNVYKV